MPLRCLPCVVSRNEKAFLNDGMRNRETFPKEFLLLRRRVSSRYRGFIFCFPLIVIQITFQRGKQTASCVISSEKYVFTLAILMSHNVERRTLRYAEIYLLQYKLYKTLLQCHWFMVVKMKFISSKNYFMDCTEIIFIGHSNFLFYPWLFFPVTANSSIYNDKFMGEGRYEMGWNGIETNRHSWTNF